VTCGNGLRAKNLEEIAIVQSIILTQSVFFSLDTSSISKSEDAQARSIAILTSRLSLQCPVVVLQSAQLIPFPSQSLLVPLLTSHKLLPLLRTPSLPLVLHLSPNPTKPVNALLQSLSLNKAKPSLLSPFQMILQRSYCWRTSTLRQ